MNESRFEHVLFVCTNEGKPGQNKRRCAPSGSPALLARIKEKVAQLGLKGRVRATSSGCLDLCAKGCAVAVFSRAAGLHETWYTLLSEHDAEALVEAHCVRGERYVKASGAHSGSDQGA